jgi:serine phosphatase RsbU (regulator of sigma subunit)
MMGNKAGVGRVMEEVFAFAKGCSQGDDMTLVVVGVKDDGRI